MGIAASGVAAWGAVEAASSADSTPVVRSTAQPGEAFGGLSPGASPSASTGSVTPNASTSAVRGPTGTPRALSIPALGQRGVPIVMPVGVIGGSGSAQGSGADDERGLLSAPASAQQLGWYRYCYSVELPSKKCVEYRGPLVIDGHVGIGNDGALADVWRLKAGDKALLTDSAGRTWRFTAVGKPIAFVKHEMSKIDLFTAAHNGQLLLLTCYSKSTWVGGHHTENVGMLFTLDG